MKNLEQEIREAFDAVTMPAGLKECTLKLVDQHAAERNHAVDNQHTAGGQRAAESQHIAEGQQSRSVAAPKKPSQPRMKVIRNLGFALAACLVLVAIGFGGIKLYLTETAFVGIDVNPSIELGINRFDQVVSQQAVNDDGADVLADISLVGKSYDEAMTMLSANEIFMASVSSNGYVEISVTSDDEAQSKLLSQTSDSYLKAWPCEGSCHATSSADRNAAAEVGMGINRYRAAQQLIELDPSVTLEECRALSMRELRDRIVAAGGSLDEDHGHAHGANAGGMGSGSGGNGGGMGSGSGNGRRHHADNSSA